MDLAVVYPRFDRLGGAERFGLNLMREWMGEHDITLYALSIDDGLLHEFGVEVNYVTCETNIPFWRSNTLTVMAAVRSMGKRLGAHDLYVLNQFPTHLVDRHPNLWYPQEPARMLYDLYPDLMGSPDVPVHMKLMAGAYIPLLRYLDKKLNHADKVVANSMYSASYLKSIYGVEPSVVYCGVESEGKPSYVGEYALAVGPLTRAKRLDLAVEAMRHVEGLELLVAGAGPESDNLKKMAGENVKFLGKVPEEEMADLYSKALCTVYTPIREPFGLVPLESLAHGTPVVGCREGGFTEVVEDGVDCFLVDPTPENIAEKINYLRENLDAVKRMGEKGLLKAGEYTWGKTADELLKLMETLV